MVCQIANSFCIAWLCYLLYFVNVPNIIYRLHFVIMLYLPLLALHLHSISVYMMGGSHTPTVNNCIIKVIKNCHSQKLVAEYYFVLCKIEKECIYQSRSYRVAKA